MSSIPTQLNLNEMSQSDLLDLAKAFQVLDEKKQYNKLDFVFPRYLANKEGYKKHLIFMKAGSIYKERALIAGNRTGKTYTSMAEVAFHVTGKYPEGWEGKRFEGPIEAWVVGKTHETTRDILQKYLYGNYLDPGTGFIPRVDIIRKTTKSGIQDAVQDLYVQHYDEKGHKDGISHLSFKSYVQGIEAFMGAQVHVVGLDEEPPERGIYSECVTRTMTTQGIILCTFTPLEGLSEVVLSFLPGGRFPMGGIGPVEEVL